MVKQAPTVGRLLTMVLFALSCFGLLLFLWISFGGSTPLKPEGYRFKVALPEATQLAVEADVRVAGVPIGKVRAKERDPEGNATLATIEIDPRYAPISSDARVTLRQKTLLGETYVAMTTGTRDAPKLGEGEILRPRQVQPTVELDEILNTLDPFTRQAFRTWQRSAAGSIRDRGDDLNDALGNLPGFVTTGGDLLEVLDEQRAALGGLVRNTGLVFQAITRRENQLDRVIRNGNTVFTAIQREREAFARTFQVFPTFLDESRRTFRRLDRFARVGQPVVADLKVAMDDLAPTLDALGDFGPDLQRLFTDLDPLIDISRRSLPATAEVLDGLRPVLDELGPWLGELNPTLNWVAHNEATLADMFGNLGVATGAKTVSQVPGAPGHYLRQLGPLGVETAAIHTNRVSGNRGNAYHNPGVLAGKELADTGAYASWDCNHVGERPGGGVPSAPACRAAQPYTRAGTLTALPQFPAESYDRP
ncbi:MlaD family protein [Paraconexibacter algicola]|uniref:MCE family protein n=1 Tax=Paraconexibacter algicola TaxID=2133960 RepID=A0A2T4UBV4_9ACTN|nr:MlaD family protein [Paraconexibacter algicola]PTL54397.1 MCE family protein [Paraconexibacter algicola]